MKAWGKHTTAPCISKSMPESCLLQLWVALAAMAARWEIWSWWSTGVFRETFGDETKNQHPSISIIPSIMLHTFKPSFSHSLGGFYSRQEDSLSARSDQAALLPLWRFCSLDGIVGWGLSIEQLWAACLATKLKRWSLRCFKLFSQLFGNTGHAAFELRLSLAMLSHEPGSKFVVLGMVIPPLIGNPYSGY